MNVKKPPVTRGLIDGADDTDTYFNVLKIYNHFAPFCGIFTNREKTSTATKSTTNISISNFFEIDMGGVV